MTRPQPPPPPPPPRTHAHTRSHTNTRTLSAPTAAATATATAAPPHSLRPASQSLCSHLSSALSYAPPAQSLCFCLRLQRCGAGLVALVLQACHMFFFICFSRKKEKEEKGTIATTDTLHHMPPPRARGSLSSSDGVCAVERPARWQQSCVTHGSWWRLAKQ